MLLFAGDDYYPRQPASDFLAVIHDLGEVDELLRRRKVDWWQVLDVNGGLVAEGRPERTLYDGGDLTIRVSDK